MYNHNVPGNFVRTKINSSLTHVLPNHFLEIHREGAKGHGSVVITVHDSFLNNENPEHTKLDSKSSCIWLKVPQMQELADYLLNQIKVFTIEDSPIKKLSNKELLDKIKILIEENK